MEYVQNHLADPDLSLNALETRFELSAGTINKVFRENTGDTFYAYLSNIRIDHAKALLAQGGHTISEVAVLTGYTNDVSFRRAFIRRAGISPHEYIQTCAPRA